VGIYAKDTYGPEFVRTGTCTTGTQATGSHARDSLTHKSEGTYDSEGTRTLAGYVDSNLGKVLTITRDLRQRGTYDAPILE
jgi:hypothetical protein